MKEGDSRTYVVPLRKEWLNAPKWRRSKRAITALRKFLIRHTKSEDVKLSKWINEAVWRRGGKNPPPRLKVTVKQEKAFAVAELAELPARAKRLEEKEEARKKALPKKEEKPAESEEAPKAEAVKKPSAKKTKKKAKKTSKKELLKELEEAKNQEEKKKRAKMTKAQEISLKK